jgi:VWFA-related protein
MLLRVAWLIVLLSLLQIPTSFADQPATSAPDATSGSLPPVIRSSTRLVQVSVFVQDGKGKPITGLEKEDFTVLDQGKPQKIAVFAAEPPAPLKLSHPLPKYVFTNRFDLRGQETEGVTVVLFDALNTSGNDQIYVRKQVLRFLQTLKPGDHVAIYALTRELQVLHEFTQDAGALVNAVNHFAPKEGTAYDASHPEKVDLVGMTGEKDWLSFQNALNNSNAMIADRNTINRATTTSAAIEAIADHLAAIPGQKSLIWVSGGFPIQIGTVPIGESDIHNRTGAGSRSDARSAAGAGEYAPVGGEDPTNKLPRSDRDQASLEPELAHAIFALNRVNMTIYPVDARGVELDPATDPATRSATTSQDSSIFTQRQETRDSSRLLADRTGGQAFFGNNDLDDAMRRAMDDGRYAYTIAFYPDHEKWNGKFHEIKISVKASGAHLRYRKGYFAVGYHTEKVKDVNTALREAALNPLEATTLGMIVEGKPVGQSDAHQLELRIGIDPKQLVLEESHDQQKGSLDLLFLQRDSTGKVLLAEKQHLDLNLPQAQYEFLAKSGMVLEHHMEVNPQAVEICVVVSDGGSGTTGSVKIPAQTFFQAAANPATPADKPADLKP